MSKAGSSAQHHHDSLYKSRECALSLTKRSAATRHFLLHKPSATTDINHLLTHRPAFVISTEEEQCGALPGRIALNYLLMPLFYNQDGISGGLVATTYTKRTHPLHAPTVMAHVRLGRYLRDDNTGEWTFLTRNNADGLTRLQYVKVNQGLNRERIGMTCLSKLFDKGDIHDSVLFQCHDREWRSCPMCNAPPQAKCGCLSTLSKLRKSRFLPINQDGQDPSTLSQLTEMVLSEGDAKWQGHVRVTVLSNLTNCQLLNIDEFMTVFSTYRTSPDPQIIANLKSLAIRERMREHACIPPLLRSNQQDDDQDNHKQLNSSDDPAISNILPDTYPIQDPLSDQPCRPTVINLDVEYEADRENDAQNPIAFHHHYAFAVDDDEDEQPIQTSIQKKRKSLIPKHEPFIRPESVAQADFYPAFTSEDLDEMFAKSTTERANHFLIAPDTNIEDMLDECAMLPADPSTLPGGTDLCLDGMVIDDDWCSRMTSDVDGNSASSTLSTTGSDCAPKPESVPLPECESLSPPDSLTEMDYMSSFPQPSKLELPPQMRSAVIDVEDINESQDSDKNTKKKTIPEESHSIYRGIRKVDTDHSPLPKESPQTSTIKQKETGAAEIDEKKTNLPVQPQLLKKQDTISKQQQNLNSNPAVCSQPTPAMATGFPVVSPSPFGAVPAQAVPGLPVGMVMPIMPVPMVPGSNGMIPTAANPHMMPMIHHGVRLAPRPAGMSVQDSVLLELGTAYNGNRAAIAARINAIEKARKAEERRKKNRQAAARSNARKKDIMDGIKAQMKEAMDKVKELRLKEQHLKEQNQLLKKRLSSTL